VGIAINSKGFIFITDRSNHRIQKFDSNGKFIKKIGNLGDENGNFWYPSGISIDSKDRVLIADWGNYRIQILDEDLNFIQSFYCNRPVQISIDLNDNIFVLADSKRKKIQIYAPMGKFIHEIDFTNEKNIVGISCFTIHKEKIFYLLLYNLKMKKEKTQVQLFIFMIWYQK